MAHMLRDQVGEIASRNTPPEPAVEAVRNADSLLRGIYEISKLLTAPARLEITLANVANVLSSFVQMRRGAIVVLDAEGQPQISATSGGTVPQSGAGSVVPQAVIDKIAATGVPIVIQDTRTSELFQADPQSSSDTTATAFIGVPLKAEEKIFGALSIDRVRNGTTRFCYEEDLRFLAMVANLVGRTIRLHRTLSTARQPLIEQPRPEESLDEDRTRSAPRPHVKIDGIIGESPALKQVLEIVSVVARTNSTVLLRGESGTGKEFFAQAIHKLSHRSEKSFVKLNCAALPESVLESELFGHEKGAFTGAILQRAGRFELANGGTLLLDEIGEISPAFQAKLLRVLQEGELERVGGTRTLKVDVRLICATNKDLEAAVRNGEFRADLYYRINVVPIVLPPLRERPGDIPRLAKALLDRFNKENHRDLAFTPSALDLISQCYFPGNVRELENCVRRTATLARSTTITPSDFACQNSQCLSSLLWKGVARSHGGYAVDESARGNMMPVASPMPAPRVGASQDEASPGKTCDPNHPACPAMNPRLTERDRLIDAMEKAGWVQARAARVLGLTPRQVGYALRRHRIGVKKF
ncbi:MAG: nif-specific transcriptional activator NifA [Mesorhizobium sp.]|uniref:nif-specific transcriptional activator NifA n=1 Tax=unclassified Mesorhizobium TaxID=325217 RepID=UPI000F761028|nr:MULTISPECIES: nif-specific transcriptional activator NifA [unclassified Mesorhizobium]RVC81472.1 nif-specific transcriptional activator NifA [Mesorhizobium sp. M2A.F.Ca.ET.046.02.1.1]AZO34203.1 nif-specific transcriptional activator NifA [Mesorhizobium sp. M2A.F.Ca.ET.046.03.2.1]AZO71635.1 nif-specific transcriptional activator NifA [Mesorhizobium sp. M1D.F.Ca.ET.043.01.1.1]RWB49787.1 MAG: nif-specific transcriptional activator NifA [Mesorhizobium sp.]RWE22483.1 MAG: nif-specific transcript